MPLSILPPIVFAFQHPVCLLLTFTLACGIIAFRVVIASKFRARRLCYSTDMQDGYHPGTHASRSVSTTSQLCPWSFEGRSGAPENPPLSAQYVQRLPLETNQRLISPSSSSSLKAVNGSATCYSHQESPELLPALVQDDDHLPTLMIGIGHQFVGVRRGKDG
ncbi:hypothetical protein VTK73DRAFT_613 [Phialemonium thermophilum]|uniref:Uncharacterized protein n=1 Tax=Phialemonium thermophilum TaxID=223376 RepID=A0ABR3XDG1_9PEZI